MTNPNAPLPRVLCVPAKATRTLLTRPFSAHAWPGLRELIRTSGDFRDKHSTETDPAWKQVVTYAVVRSGESVLRYQRPAKVGEVRLSGRFSLGVGGHVEEIDCEAERPGGSCVVLGAMRELREELGLQIDLRLSILGVISDESDAVGKAHVGVAMEADLPNGVRPYYDSSIIDPRWLRPSEILDANLESWSALILGALFRQGRAAS
jgi:predicted NUDIX family phosphoesterase